MVYGAGAEAMEPERGTLQHCRGDTIRANAPAKDDIVDVWVSTINKP